MSDATPYGIPGPGADPSSASAAPRGARGPKILLTIAAVLLVIAAVVLATAVVSFVRVGTSTNEVSSGQAAALELDGATVYGVYADSVPTCEARDPSGGTVTVSASKADVSVNDHHVRSAFTTGAAGTYTITCDTLTGDPVWVGTMLSVGGLVAGTFGIVGAVFVGMLGLGLIVGGIVWYVTRRRDDARAQQPGGFPGAPRA